MGGEKFAKAVKVAKVDSELGLVFGYGIVCKENGEEYFDSQGDHIPEEVMLKYAAEFMQTARVAKDMHTGEKQGTIVFAFPLTEEIAKALGIVSKKYGLLLAMKPEPKLLAKFKDGTYTGFSIGGVRILDEPVEASS